MSGRPWVTVVTPSLDQGPFLPRALDSVLGQDYPHLELWVIDGGSRDGTLEVLREYAARDPRLRWLSGKDRGQSDAINKGLRRARGDVVAWLNADDVYLPGAVSKAVAHLEAHPEVGLVYGRGEIVDQDGRTIGPFAEWEPFSLWRLIHMLDYVLQPATFFRRRLVEEIGYLDAGLNWAMDWNLWLELAARAEVLAVDDVLAQSRVYGATKTATGGWRRIGELGRLARRWSGRFWTPGVKLYALDTLHRDLRARLPAPFAHPLCRVVEGWMGRLARRGPVYADGWLTRRAYAVVPRRWRRARLLFEAVDAPAGGFAVTLRHAGRRLARLPIPRPGAYPCEVAVPAGDGPFATLEIRSNHRFRPDPAIDARPWLSILLRRVEPG
ncbi:MAG: glycosyltransferase [Acidobacteria bacterium]|nr:MAG: glycosyltransferase [Acidobacteriota bacterium]